MKKVPIVFFSRVVPAVILLGLIIFLWKSRTYLIDIPDEIFDPATLHISPIGPKTIIEYMGLGRVLLLALFVVLSIYSALAFLFRLRIYGNKQFPRKIFLGFLLIALAGAATFGPLVVANIKSTETQKRICSELARRQGLAREMVDGLRRSLLSSQPDDRLGSADSSHLAIDRIYAFERVYHESRKSIDLLERTYRQGDTLTLLLNSCHCDQGDTLRMLPFLCNPIYGIAARIAQRMDSTVVDAACRKLWHRDVWWSALVARERVGELLDAYSPETLRYYCVLGDSFFSRRDVAMGVQCYKIAGLPSRNEVIKHLYLSASALSFDDHMQIWSLIKKDFHYADLDIVDDMIELGILYLDISKVVSRDSSVSSSFLVMGKECLEIAARTNITQTISHVLSYDRYFPVERQLLILNIIEGRWKETEPRAHEESLQAVEILQAVPSFVRAGEVSIAKALWDIATNKDYPTHGLYSEEYDTISHTFLPLVDSLSNCPLPRLWGNDIVTDSIKMSSLWLNEWSLASIVLADQKQYRKLLEFGTTIDSKGKKEEEPFLYALAFKGSNDELFRSYRQQLWDGIIYDNAVLWHCEYFSRLGDYMMQFDDTIAIRLAVSDFDNAIAFWTESYGGWIFEKKHSNKEALAKFMDKKREALDKLQRLISR
jgi:hypothetical protein